MSTDGYQIHNKAYISWAQSSIKVNMLVWPAPKSWHEHPWHPKPSYLYPSLFPKVTLITKWLFLECKGIRSYKLFPFIQYLLDQISLALQKLVLWHCCQVFHCIVVPQFIYPFHHWLTLGLVPFLAIIQQPSSNNEHVFWSWYDCSSCSFFPILIYSFKCRTQVFSCIQSISLSLVSGTKEFVNLRRYHNRSLSCILFYLLNFCAIYFDCFRSPGSS